MLAAFLVFLFPSVFHVSLNVIIKTLERFCYEAQAAGFLLAFLSSQFVVFLFPLLHSTYENGNGTSVHIVHCTFI